MKDYLYMKTLSKIVVFIVTPYKVINQLKNVLREKYETFRLKNSSDIKNTNWLGNAIALDEMIRIKKNKHITTKSEDNLLIKKDQKSPGIYS